MSESKVATEVAEAEFQRFLDTMYLKFDLETMDAEDRKAFTRSKEVVIRSMTDGRLMINEKGEPEFTPFGGGTKITFHEPKGATFMASDQHKPGQDVHKSYAMLADMTGTPAVAFSKMDNRDLKVCEKIAVLFLASS